MFQTYHEIYNFNKKKKALRSFSVEKKIQNSMNDFSCCFFFASVLVNKYSKNVTTFLDRKKQFIQKKKENKKLDIFKKYHKKFGIS